VEDQIAPLTSQRRPGPGARPRSYKTDAVVLRSRPGREADRLVTILTPAAGKLLVTVRGARRINSRLGGHLDVFNRTRLTLALGHRFDVVTGAESIESFGALKSDLDRLAAALYLVELTDALVPEEAPHPGAYGLLLDALRALDQGALGRGPDVASVPRYAELRLLEDAGYLPELTSCLVCGNELAPGHHRFAPGLGGVVCDTCVVPVGQVLPLSLDALKVLRHYAHSPMEVAVALHLAPELAGELERVLGAAVTHVLEREPATAEFVEQVRRLRRNAAGSAPRA
jgi:DNA repair protein RecO (recombination protein O)